MVYARKGWVPIRWYQCRPSEIIEGSILLKKIPTTRKLPKTLLILVLVQFGIEALTLLDWRTQQAPEVENRNRQFTNLGRDL